MGDGGERGFAGSGLEDPGSGFAVRRAEDTEGLQLRRQETTGTVRLQHLRKILHEEGLVATARSLGVRQGATVSVPVLSPTM